MCIIAYKPAGIQFPADSVLENCFENNPDGAGIFFRTQGNPIGSIVKGFLSLDDFMSHYDKLRSNQLNEDMDVVFHFRISTSGNVDAATCHPFPITTDVTTLKATAVKTKRAVIHNGIIGAGEKDLSDTQLFVRDYLSRITNLLANKKAIEDKVGTRNRLVIFDGDHDSLFLTGDGWTTDNGIVYSNQSYQPYTPFSYNYNYPPMNCESDISLRTLYDNYCPTCGASLESIGYANYLLECPECGMLMTGNDHEVLIESSYLN